jgi:hypothetical protein
MVVTIKNEDTKGFPNNRSYQELALVYFIILDSKCFCSEMLVFVFMSYVGAKVYYSLSVVPECLHF